MIQIKKNGLVVVPQGGLGNRMRVIRSAYDVALRMPFDVEVAFAADEQCNCSFSDLFQEIQAPCDNFKIRPAEYLDMPATKHNFYMPALIRAIVYKARRSNFNASGNEDIFKLVEQYGSVFVSTCYEFCSDDMSMADIFKPSELVLSAVEAITAQFKPYTAGFHIRATDNAEAAAASPLELFVDAARTEFKAHPDAALFVAADSDEARQQFKAELGDSVIVSPRVIDRASTEGMVAAAADMFALSRCNKIYGSYYSSFSEIAAELGGKRAQILKR